MIATTQLYRAYDNPFLKTCYEPTNVMECHVKLGGDNSNILVIFHPEILGKISNLTSIFCQMGWFNHQPELVNLRGLVYNLRSNYKMRLIWGNTVG